MVLDKTVDMMLSDDYKERFRAEYHQLTNREAKLNKMVKEYKEGTLTFVPDCPLHLLMWQLKTMQEYKYILKLRAEIEGIDL